MRTHIKWTEQRRKILVLTLIIVVAGAICAYLWLSRDNNTKPQTTTATSASPTSQQLPLFVRNGQPNKLTQRLDFLAGDWKVEKSTYIAGGTPAKPVVSRDITSHWEWIDGSGQRFLRETTKGTLAGQPYFRFGVLGYSTMDNRYEFNSVDNTFSEMMTYKGAKDSGSQAGDISMPGEFTDQGVLGDAYAGKVIGMRTVFEIASSKHFTIKLYFTPAGEAERLVDQAVYTRE